MSRELKKQLNRYRVGELPLIQSVTDRLRLRTILSEFVPKQKNEEVAPVDALMLLIANLAIGKSPLYELENWTCSLDKRCMEIEQYSQEGRFTDDRFGKVLDRLYSVDRASLMTKIVLSAVKEFKINLSQLHNDSTTVKAFGKYSGKTTTGFELKNGKSKDHRPDLKQLLFTLSISSDGAVPIHYKSYPGNRTDDTTHIETWNTLCEMHESANFLYVADCKVCTDKQLSHITENGGRVVTIVPETWREVKAFKSQLRQEKISMKEIFRKKTADQKTKYFYSYEGEYLTDKRGYRIHWICSSEKRKHDREIREKRLSKAENELRELLQKLNKRHLKTKEAILEACNKILEKFRVEKFITIDVDEAKEQYTMQEGRGRPGKNTEYKRIVRTIYTLSWSRNKVKLDVERNVDGVFPLLSTSFELGAKEALMAYKYQPRLEKRFTQLKNIHNAAPLLFKKLERIEANMFLFFVALMIQALIEREVRNKMKDYQRPNLPVYPENRYSPHPTTAKIFEVFSDVSTYSITSNNDIIEEYSDELTNTQKTILDFLGIPVARYWNRIISQPKASDLLKSCAEQ